MESHGEFTALLPPELAVAAGANAPPRLSAAPMAGTRGELDFLALLGQELAQPTSPLPPVQAPHRQLLPTAGQTLPPAGQTLPPATPPLPLGLAPQPLAEQRPVPGIPVLNIEPSTAAPGPTRPEALATPAERPPVAEIFRPTQSPLPPEVTSQTAQVERVMSAEVSSVPLRPMIFAPAAPRPAKVSLVDLSSNTYASTEVSREGGLPRGLPEAAPPRVDAQQLPVSTTGERLDYLPSARSDAGSTVSLPTSAPIAPPIVSAPASAADAFGPLPRSADQPIPTVLPDNILDSVRALSDQKGGEMRLRLNPPELGYLEIKVSVSDEQTFVSITANNSNARDVLEQHIGRLKTLLDASGLNLADAQVSSERHTKQGQHDALPEWATTDLKPTLASATPPQAMTSSHQIDLFA